MSEVSTYTPTGLKFTDSAAHKVKNLITEEENPTLKLRVFVTGGGCSGFEYGFTFDEDVEDDDTVIENAGVTLVVDALSLQGSRFVVTNPNASSTCGCGNSFSI